MPAPGGVSPSGANLFYKLPVPGGRLLWISTYRVVSGNVGVFISCRRGSPGEEVLQQLVSDPEALAAEVGADTKWGKGAPWPYADHSCSDFEDFAARAEAIRWLRVTLNRYVNVFRPRVKAIVDEMGL